jgi:hypothetical protein
VVACAAVTARPSWLLGVWRRIHYFDWIGRLTWWPRKSICKTYENCDRKPEGTDLRIVSAGGANCDAVTFIKGIGNNLKALTIHFYVHGWDEAEILDLDAAIGANLHDVPAILCKLSCRPETRPSFPDGFFDTADPFLCGAGVLLRPP